MKLNKSQLKQIIKEELHKLFEQFPVLGRNRRGVPYPMRHGSKIPGWPDDVPGYGQPSREEAEEWALKHGWEDPYETHGRLVDVPQMDLRAVSRENAEDEVIANLLQQMELSGEFEE